MKFEQQPTLIGDILELHPLQETDFDELYEAANDPKIWEQHPAWDRYKEPVFREFFRVAMESGMAFKVIDKNTGKIIGSSRYHGYDEEKSEIEIGWSFLSRKYWGGAYNKEMKTLMLNHAHRFVGTVIFKVGPDNIRSQKAMEKIGGIRAGTRKDDTGLESFIYKIRRV